MKRTLYFFLDVDGVLNSRQTNWTDSFTIDTTLLSYFNGLLEEARKLFNVKIILSSSWQTSLPHKNYLHSYGIEWDDVAPQTRLSGYRSTSIRDYIVGHNIDQRLCIVFDDMVGKSFEEQFPGIRVVATSFDYGFNLDRLNEALLILQDIHKYFTPPDES